MRLCAWKFWVTPLYENMLYGWRNLWTRRSVGLCFQLEQLVWVREIWGTGVYARNTCSLSAFITARHTEDVGFAGPATCFSFLFPLLYSWLHVFLNSLVPLLDVTSLQREFPPILPVHLQTYCLCSQPFFPSFSIVSCSLCSSLSNNRLFIFTLVRVLLCFFPHIFFYKCTIISLFVALFLPFVCVFVGIVRKKWCFYQ